MIWSNCLFTCVTASSRHSPLSCHATSCRQFTAPLLWMSARSQDIKVSVTPAVKDLRSLFEQKAKESPANSSGSLRPSDNSVLFGSRASTSRRSSPTPFFDDQPESLTPSPEPSLGPFDQNSLRKRPPPPPPSRGPKQQVGSPSPSSSPLLRATLEQGVVPENQSPPAVKQRLAARPPPPLPELRSDRTVGVGSNPDTKGNFDEPPNNRR